MASADTTQRIDKNGVHSDKCKSYGAQKQIHKPNNLDDSADTRKHTGNETTNRDNEFDYGTTGNRLPLGIKSKKTKATCEQNDNTENIHEDNSMVKGRQYGSVLLQERMVQAAADTEKKLQFESTYRENTLDYGATRQKHLTVIVQ